MQILVVDAQGGGLGKQIIMALRKRSKDLDITAVGTNSTATTSMLRAGASRAATGENAIIVAARKAQLIIGPVGIVIADSLLGEITPRMARAIGSSNASRILIPFNNCDNYFVGLDQTNLTALIAQVVDKVFEYLE